MTCMKIELKNLKKEVIGVALVSPEDYENVKKYSWCMDVQKRKSRTQAYALGKINGKNIRMHQFIMGNAPQKGLVIDHKNNIGLDNQRCNLHFVTPGTNSQNRQKKTNASSKYIGVQKRKGKFAVMQCGQHLGTFESEIEAAKHYDKYVTIKYNGKGRTNFAVKLDDIKDITLEDLIPKITRTLPKNICQDKNGKYFANIKYRNKTYISKHVDTLDEAHVELDNFNQIIQEIQKSIVKTHLKKPIERNAQKAAIIVIRNNKNTVVGECIVDDKFWHELTQIKWNMKDGYAQARIDNKSIKMHTFLMNKKHMNVDMIDHINRNRLDNRMSNLRYVDASKNGQNKSKKLGCASSYIGVTKHKNKWRARINFKGETFRLKAFDNEIDAAKAYNAKALELYGPNASLNKFD